MDLPQSLHGHLYLLAFDRARHPAHPGTRTHHQRRRRRLIPIRCYATRVRPKREKPFAAEYALLAELGIGRS